MMFEKKGPQNKVWFGNHRSSAHTNTHTDAHKHRGLYSTTHSHTHNLWYNEAFFLPPSLSHSYVHTNLHSLIWADSGNRSTELAGGPGRERRAGFGGGSKRGQEE